MQTVRYNNVDVEVVKETKYTYKLKFIDGSRKTVFKTDKNISVDTKSYDDFLDEHIF